MNYSIKLALAVSSFFFVAIAGAQDLSAVMTCYNPQQTPLSMTASDNTVGGGKKASAAIQFNVDRPAGLGTIFVNGGNNGVCKVVLGPGLRTLTTPQWSAISEDPANAFGKLTVSQVQTQENGRDVTTFSVGVGGTSVPSTVTIRFTVFYQ